MAERGAGKIRLVVFDVDGTLIEHPEDKTVWQVLNERFLATRTLNVERFEAFRAGRLSYADWVALDVGDWKKRGVRREEIVDAIRACLRPVPGAAETIGALRERGYRVAVVSGTLDITLELLLADIDFDRVFTNKLFFDESGCLSGWQATPYDVDGKAHALEELSRSMELALDEIAFVGDHWNDLSALRIAGFGFAYKPKDLELCEVADVVLPGGSLTQILEHLPGAQRD